MTLVRWLQTYNGAVVAAATVALLFVTCGYAWLTWQMLRAARRQADAAWGQVQDTRAAELLTRLNTRNMLGTRAGQLLFKLHTLPRSEPPAGGHDPVPSPWTERDLRALEVTAVEYNADLLGLVSSITECLSRLTAMLRFVADQSTAETVGKSLPHDELLDWSEQYTTAERALDELHAIANAPGADASDFAKLQSLQTPPETHPLG